MILFASVVFIVVGTVIALALLSGARRAYDPPFDPILRVEPRERRPELDLTDGGF